MLKWFSNEEGGTGPGAPGSPQGAGGGEVVLGEVLDRLAQTEQLVAHLKELIREKDAALCTKEEQLKTEKEAFEAKLSKMRLQNKAKVTSLTTKLEEMKKQEASPTQAGQDSTPSKKGGSEGGEQASRGKILLLRKKVEELEHHLSQRDEELAVKTLELKAQWQRGQEMDAMLAERDSKLAEKEVYIVHLQTAMSPSVTPAPEQKLSEDGGRLQELQMLVQNLTKKVEEGEERYSLLQEQKESLRELLVTEKDQYEEKENMYKQNIQTFKDIILQKDNKLMDVNQRHEQELFKLAAKSDASADLDQLLKALKQKLHEKEEVLLGKGQVIDVLQGEVDGRDQQIKELVERARRLQVERESLHSKLEAEKHVMRAQIRDLMEKQQAELRHVADKHQTELTERETALRGQLGEQRRAPSTARPSQTATLEEGRGGDTSVDSGVAQRIAELEALIISKTEEASKSEAKFLKMKAWSKSRIRQLEDELRKNQSGGASPDVTLCTRITDLEEEREEILWKLEQYEEVKAKNDLLEAKLVVYEEQQRTMQADLEQVTKRAASQASESGSADDTQSQVLEWQEMLSEAVTARDRAKEEKATMVLRLSHMEEEREVLASRQQELEEELAQARGLRPHGGKKLGGPAPCTLQEDFEFSRQQSGQDHRSASESGTPMEGENMGGWWPEYSSSNSEGLRSVVQELELERNQLQEQIMGLEERCQDLEDRLQLQTRIEWLQNESERLQSQLAVLRSQQSRDAEKHQLLVTSLNKQLKGLSDTQECLETSLIEKENMLAKTSEKLELIDSLQDSLKDKETLHKDVSDKLLQTGQHLTEVLKKCSTFEKQCLELKTTLADLTQKLSVLKEKSQKQEAIIETLQTDLDQTNDELDKLNTTHLEERAQLIHDLQSCEREIDNLKDILLEKDKEICVISGNMVEYAEQITVLKQEIKNKEEDLVRIESALTKAQIGKDSQDSDKQSLHTTMAELMEKLKYTENELSKVKEEKESKLVEVKDLTKQVKVDTQTIQDLRAEILRHNVSHHNHLSECEAQISSLKEHVTLASQKLQESESLNSQLKENNSSSEKLKDQLQDKVQIYEKDLKSFKEEQNTLFAEGEKHKQDLQALSKQLEEQVECQEQVKRTMQEKVDTIISLEEKVKITQEQAEGDRQKFSTELETRNIEIEQLGKELQGKSQNISKLKSLLKSMKTENQHLQTDLKGMTENLESQKQHVDELSDKLGASVEEKKSLMTQINGLTKQNETLQLEVVERTKSLSELSNERVSLLSKIRAFETQQSEDVTIIKGLQKDKDGLSTQVHELNMVLELNKHSISETLLEKTNECTNLIKMLRASEETVVLLQKQVDNMSTEIEQLHLNMGEKEKTVTDLKSQMETQQGQLIQLQETLSLLQEQGNALKSGLLEKDTLLKQKQEECYFLKSEVTQQKCILSELKIVAETSQAECSQLSQLVKEREETLTCMTRECQDSKDELNKRKESVLTLSSQLGVMNESATKLESENSTLKKTLEDHVAELRQEMEQGRVESLGLHSHIKALSEQHHQLQTAYEIREKELAQQMQVAFDLDRKVTGTSQQISDLSTQLNSLTEENHKLQQELTQKTKSVFELTTERSLIQEQMSGLEIQHSENRSYIDVLLKDMNGLRQAADELSKALGQTKQSLLEKTNEYTHLTSLFREREEAIASLHKQIDSMNLQIHQLNNDLADKDTTLIDKCTQIERQQIQLVQLQETVRLHQEQDTALKSGLMEKDTMLLQKTEECSSLQSEIVLQKERISNLQGEAELLRGECSELSCRLEEKEQTIRHTEQEYQNYKDEQNTTNESVMLISSKLGFMKENTAKLEIEVTELRASLENRVAEKDKLRQEMDQKQTEVVDLMDNMQALNEQKVRLKTEFQKSVTEASRSLEEISVLRTEISNRDSQMCNLTEQMKAACADKESLALMLQQKDDSMRQQNMFIKQLQTNLEKVEGQMSQKMEVITELQIQAQSLQESLQDRDISLHETERELTVLREKLTSNSKSFKTQLHSNAETITQLQGELVNLVEKNSKLTERFTEQEVQLRGQVDNLTSESSLLKETLKEKEKIILKNKNISSTVSKSFNSKLQAKESEFNSLKEQLSDLQELISKLNITLHTQTVEITNLKKTLEEKEAAVLDQSKALQHMHRGAEEAAFFKAQFTESTNLVSQLQSQIQQLSTKSANISKSAEEKQGAFVNLQEKFAAHLEELQEARKELSQRTEDISSLSEALSGCNIALQAAEVNTEALKNESSLLRQDLQQLKTINFNLSKEHENALADHQRSTSSLTVEIERLKSQHLHVAAQVNALRENLEQKEMDLHAINSQYTAQVKHTEHLVSEIQRLEEKNKDLKEEMLLSKQEHQQRLDATLQEKAKLQKGVHKLIAERDEVGRSHSHKIQRIQEQMQLQTQQQSSSMNEALEKMIAEKENLQIEVSVRSEKIAELKSVIQKIEQTLQDSENEWISVLERETQDKNLLVEQLKSVENEMKSKDFKVQALKQDLDSLHEKLTEATSAIRQGSDQLKEKELEASASRVQLQKILASVLEKDRENVTLKQALLDMESKARKLEVSKECSDKDLSVLSQTMSERLVALEEEKVSLHTTIKQLRESHQSDLSSLKGELDNVSELHRKIELTLKEKEKMYHGESQQKLVLQEQVEYIQMQFQTEAENMRDVTIKLSALNSEIQKREDQITCMNIQLSQQKELIAGLSQQVREKDVSVSLVMESVSNERMKHTEENNNLKSQVESLENTHINSVKQLEEVKSHLSLSQSQIETKNFENGELVKENDNLKAQLNKLSKEKEVMKKKLQAALVVRKDLLKQIEEHANQKEINVRNGIELLALQNELQKVSAKAQVSTEEHEVHIHILKQQLLQQEGELLELAQEQSKREDLVEQLKSNVQTLQTKLNEQEVCLTSSLHTLNEKSAIIEQLYCSMSDDKEAFEHDRCDMRIKFNQLQDEMKKQEDIFKQELTSSVSAAVDLENYLAKEKQEKALFQKKAQAALLARKETIKKSQENEKKYNQELSELKNDFKCLRNQHCNQTNELTAIQLTYDQKAKELEDIRKTSLSNLDELETLRQLVEEKDNTLQCLKMALAEREGQYQSFSPYQMEAHQFNLENISETFVTEKTEQQLQQQIHLHEVATEKLRTEGEDLQQKCMEDASKTKDRDSQMTTKKLQAALISRREILKENYVLKEQIETLSAKNKDMEASYSALKISVTNLKQLNENLESSVSSLSKNKEKLAAEIEGILNDNHNLSAACESLKLRLENITEQKQAFSFQLESLKDSQLTELSEWKSKHEELKQQYDSLLQAYENVSSEVDKMRPLLEGARREKQEAVFKAYTLESEREKQISEMEEEHEKIKEKMQMFARTKQQKIEELEEENQNMKKELLLFDKQISTVDELTTRNQQLEAKIHSLKESSEELQESLTELRESLTELRHENGSLAEELKEASCSLEKLCIESKASENSMQVKLDEALNLNNSLTTQIETHKTELAAQLEINELMLNERRNISERLNQMQNEHEEELGKKDLAKAELQEIINRHSQEIISLNEKVRILEDDKSLLQEELENVQEISDRVKNENEYLEIMTLKNCKGIEELTESVSGLQAQNTQLSSQLTASREEKAQVFQEKEKLELKLVKEFEKLKMVQRGNEGSKNLKEELQELLKDKHHEINQLQHDCIKYQELILDLERSLCTSHVAHELLKRELEEMTHRMFNEVERRKHIEKELKNPVIEARKEMASICSEKNQLLVEVSEKSKEFECQVLERTQALDSDSIVGQQKSVNMKRQLVLQKPAGKVQSSKDTESKVVVELGRQLDSQDLQINTLKRETETHLANIASLSSSTQGTVEGDLNATKGFKHEIRVLLHQMDDLNSENAMLRAQLIRYREDLNQVLSIKDNQLKEQLKKQQDTIKTLENQKATTEKQHNESLLELQRERDANNVLKAEKAELQTQVTHTDADMLALKTERAQSNECKVIADLQQAVATKAAECNNLQQKLFAQKVAADELKNSMQRLENETDKKLTEAEDKYNSELEAFEREVELIRNVKENADQRLAELAQDILQKDHLLSEARGQTKGIKCQNESLSNAMVALQNDRDQLIEDFKIMQNRYDDELKETRAAMNKVERCLGDATSELATLSKERHILVQKLSALKSKDAQSQLAKLMDELSKALSEKEGELKRVSLENDTYSRQVSAFSRSMASIQDDRDRLMHELMLARREGECKQGASLGAVNSVNQEESNSLKSSIDSIHTERDGLEMRKKVDELQRALQQAQSSRLKAEKEVSRYQAELAKFRSDQSSRALKEQHQAGERRDGHPIKESMALVGSAVSEGTVVTLETERAQLQRDLQRCLYEIQQRDLYCQQLNAKLQQEVEEKGGVVAQLRVVSQTLRDSQLNLGQLQDRCYWLENQRQASSNQGQALQGALSMEVAPGAPQERNSAVDDMDTMEAVELRANLMEAQQCVSQLSCRLSEERTRREAAEDALGSLEGRAKSIESSPSRDFSIQLETEEEWEALILNSNEPLITRKVKGGVLACRRWLRGRSLYCSKLLTTRARSRYFFLAYLLTLHMAVLMCLTGAL